MYTSSYYQEDHTKFGQQQHPLRNMLKVSPYKQLFWKKRNVSVAELTSCIRPSTLLKRWREAIYLSL